MQRAKRGLKRWGIGIAGGVVLLAGIIMIPYPGPGWATVFLGLAILATEFAWAQHLLDVARSKYDAWTVWLKHQPPLVRFIVLALTGLVVVLTLWLLNVFGLINTWFNLPFAWLKSPLF